MTVHKDTKKYYDDFSNVYEKHRHHGYHQMIDDLEISILKPYVTNRKVLEAGCGTGLILQRVAEIADEAVGIDLSPGMLAHARNRGLKCVEGDLCKIPFDDNSFDTVYSFKVLPHVMKIKAAIKEMSRVLKPGGYLVLEFYNPYSFRGIIKCLKPASKITDQTTDAHIFTRYDTQKDILQMLPDNLVFEERKGIRIVTPIAAIHNVPVFSSILRTVEQNLVATPLNSLAGFNVVIIKKI